MKKVAWLLLLALVLSIPVSVGAEKVKLRWTTCCKQNERFTLFQAIADQYMTQHPDVEIEWSYPAGNYTVNMKTYIAADTAPDVMWIGADIWAFTDILLPLNDLVNTDKGAASINPAMLRMNQWQGKQIGIPYGANSQVMMYNNDHFATAGLAKPTIDWNYDDLYRMSKRLTVDLNGDGKIDQYGVHLFDVRQWAFTAGGDFYTPDQRQVRFANPVTMAMMQFAADTFSGLSGISLVPENAAAYLNGAISMRTIGIYDLPALRKTNFSWDVIKLPAWVQDGTNYENTYVSLESWAIPSTTKHPKEAKEFLSFLLSNEVMKQITASGIVIPTQKRMTAQLMQTSAPPANLKAYIEVLDHGHQSFLTHPYGRTLGDWFKTETSWVDLWAGKVPVKTVLPELQEKMNSMLNEYFASRN